MCESVCDSEPVSSVEPPASVEKPARRSDHAPNGQFTKGNQARLVHGGRRSIDQPDLARMVARKRKDVLAHLGPGASVLQRDLAGDYARADTLIKFMEKTLTRGGPLTGKGRARAALSMLEGLMDRRLRLALRLGLEAADEGGPGLEEVMRDE